MKNNPLGMTLVAVLFLSAAINVGLTYKHIFTVREARELQMKANMINNKRTLAQALLNDVVKYSEKNPAIDPLLKSLGIKEGGPAQTPKPATR